MAGASSMPVAWCQPESTPAPPPTNFTIDFNYDQFDIDVQDWMNEMTED